MKAKKVVLTIDYAIQFLILLLGFCAIPTVIFSGFALFAIGCWQMLSALLLGLVYQSFTRKLYFSVASLYLMVLYFGIKVSDVLLPSDETLWGFAAIFGFLCIPISAACWYFRFTQNELNGCKN